MVVAFFWQTSIDRIFSFLMENGGRFGTNGVRGPIKPLVQSRRIPVLHSTGPVFLTVATV